MEHIYTTAETCRNARMEFNRKKFNFFFFSLFPFPFYHVFIVFIIQIRMSVENYARKQIITKPLNAILFSFTHFCKLFFCLFKTKKIISVRRYDEDGIFVYLFINIWFYCFEFVMNFESLWKQTFQLECLISFFLGMVFRIENS